MGRPKELFDSSAFDKKDSDDVRRERERIIIEAIKKNQPIHFNGLKDLLVHSGPKIPTPIFESIMKKLRNSGQAIEIKSGKYILFAVRGSIELISHDQFLTFAKQCSDDDSSYLEMLRKLYPKMDLQEKSNAAVTTLQGLLNRFLQIYLLSKAPVRAGMKYQTIIQDLEKSLSIMIEIIFSDKDGDLVYSTVLTRMRISTQLGKEDLGRLARVLFSTDLFKQFNDASSEA